MESKFLPKLDLALGRSSVAFSWGDRWRSVCRVRRFLMPWLMNRSGPTMRPFLEAVWNFQTLSRQTATLHYDRRLKREIVPELILVRCDEELRLLSHRFGFQLYQPAIFLFPDHYSISDIFGPNCGGLAFQGLNAIVIGNSDYIAEDIRHELVHLFAGRWSTRTPPLLTEGLAVCLQRTLGGIPLEAQTRRKGGRHNWNLQSLTDADFFFCNEYRHACYVLAGSFTAFLIERWGWQAYRTLYRSCRPHFMEWAFKRALGISFDEAEAEWRAAAM
jgi:hypothetical protein